jgi:hypothetical protein
VEKCNQKLRGLTGDAKFNCSAPRNEGRSDSDVKGLLLSSWCDETHILGATELSMCLELLVVVDVLYDSELGDRPPVGTEWNHRAW